MAAELRALLGPYELLDLPDRGVLRVRIRSWERGTMVIHPRYPGAPSEKVVEVLRVHVTEAAKVAPPYYFDITSKTLMAQMIPLLMERDYDRYEYLVTKYGVAPKARFTLERIPV